MTAAARGSAYPHAMRRLRIVSVLTSDARGGGEFAAAELLDGMARRGHEAVLLTNEPELGAGLDLVVRPLSLGPKLSSRTWRPLLRAAPRHQARLAAALRREQPYDILLLHFKKEQLMAGALPPSLAAATVWAEWGPVPDQLAHGPGRLAYAAASRRARAVIAVSDNTRDSVVAAGVDPRKVTTVPPPVEVDVVRFDPEARERLRGEWGAGKGTLVLLCVTRLDRKKRNDVVIDAVRRLGGDTLLVFAGDGDQEAPLRALAADLGDRVRFLPNPRGYVEQLLSAADVAVVAPQATEGAPRAVALGHLVGRPVVATAPSGAIPEMVPPGTGIVVTPPNDPAAVAAAFAAYRDDPERRARDGAAGRELALERHDPRRLSDEVERILLEAADGRR